MQTSATRVIHALSRTRIYRDFQRGFQAASGLKLYLHPASNADTANPPAPTEEPSVVVPVRVGGEIVGYLHTEPVAFENPTQAGLERFVARKRSEGATSQRTRLERTYRSRPVVHPRKHAGFIQMLEIFALHLGTIGNQVLIQDSELEPPIARRAKAYVAGHLDDPISLHEVSDALHVSTFYFCHMFKKATGLTFTDYLSRIRIERAKSLLLDPHRRVSEIAYAVGFGSLTHFNRVFRHLVGQSPSDFRESKPGDRISQPKHRRSRTSR